MFRLYSQRQLPWLHKQLIGSKSKICRLNSPGTALGRNDAAFWHVVLLILLWCITCWGIEQQNQETWGLISGLFLICWCNFFGPQFTHLENDRVGLSVSSQSVHHQYQAQNACTNTDSWAHLASFESEFCDVALHSAFVTIPTSRWFLHEQNFEKYTIWINISLKFLPTLKSSNLQVGASKLKTLPPPWEWLRSVQGYFVQLNSFVDKTFWNWVISSTLG